MKDRPKSFQEGPLLFGIPVRMTLDMIRLASRREGEDTPPLVELSLESIGDSEERAPWITIHTLPVEATGLGLAVGKEYDVYITVRGVVE